MTPKTRRDAMRRLARQNLIEAGLIPRPPASREDAAEYRAAFQRVA